MNDQNNENKLIDEIDDSLHNSFSTITTGRIKQETNRIDKNHSIFDNTHKDQCLEHNHDKYQKFDDMGPL